MSFSDFPALLAAKDFLGLARFFAEDALASARENGATFDREVAEAVFFIEGSRNLTEMHHGRALADALTEDELEEVSRLTVAVLEGTPLRALDPEVRALLMEALRALETAYPNRTKKTRVPHPTVTRLRTILSMKELR